MRHFTSQFQYWLGLSLFTDNMNTAKSHPQQTAVKVHLVQGTRPNSSTMVPTSPSPPKGDTNRCSIKLEPRQGNQYVPKAYQLNRPVGLIPTQQKSKSSISAINYAVQDVSTVFKGPSISQVGKAQETASVTNVSTIVIPRPVNPCVNNLTVCAATMPQDIPDPNRTDVRYIGLRMGHPTMFQRAIIRQQTSEQLQVAQSYFQAVPIMRFATPHFQIPRPTLNLCTNNNSRVTNTPFQAQATQEKLTLDNTHALNTAPSSENKRTSSENKRPHPRLTEQPSCSSLPDIKEETCEEIDIETVEEVEIQPANVNDNTSELRSNSIMAFNSNNINSLTDTINRVARGEGKVLSPRPSKCMLLGSDEMKKHRCTTSLITGDIKDNPIEPNDRAYSTKKKRNRTKATEMVNATVQSINPTVDSVGPTKKPDIKTRYLTDPKIGFNTYNGVFKADNDAIATIEAKKLSSVSGHHLLSLTDSEKEYLRHKGYIEPCTSTDDITEEDKIDEKQTRKRKRKTTFTSESQVKRENCDLFPSRIERQLNVTQEMTVKRMDVGMKNVNIPIYNLKTPVVKLTKVDLVQGRVKVRDLNTASATPQNSAQANHAKMFYVVNGSCLGKIKTEGTHNISTCTSGNTVSKPGEKIVDNVTARKLGHLSNVPNLTQTNQTNTLSNIPEENKDKYIRLGNVNYRLVHNQRENMLRGESWPKKHTPPVSAPVPSISSQTMSPASNKTVHELLTLKRATDLQNQPPGEGLLQVYGEVTNSHMNEVDISNRPETSSEICIGANYSHNSSGRKSLPVSIADSKEVTSNKTDSRSKVRLQIPIRIINPHDVVIRKASTQIPSSSRDLLKPGATMSPGKREHFLSVKANKSTIPIVSMSPKNNQRTPEKIRQKRKTLPAPKPKEQLFGRIQKSNKKTSPPSLTKKNIFVKGFRKIIKALLAKSTDPLLQMAHCLDLIPNESVLRKYRNDRQKKVNDAFDMLTQMGIDMKSPSKDPLNTKEAEMYTDNECGMFGEGTEIQNQKMTTVIQIFKDESMRCTHRVLQVKLTPRNKYTSSIHRFRHTDCPCELHFDDNGDLIEIDVQEIAKGLYIALDCVGARPGNNGSSVKTTLCVYPRSLSAIPQSTLALVISDTYDAEDASKHKPKVIDRLDEMVADILDRKTEECIHFGDMKYGSITTVDASPRYHSAIFYTGDYFSRFEKELLKGSCNGKDLINKNNNKKANSGSRKAFASWKKQGGVSPKFSERAMALKLKQNELFESCTKLKTSKQLRQNKKRKIEEDFVICVDD